MMETQDVAKAGLVKGVKAKAGDRRDAQSEAVSMDLEHLQPGGEGANAQAATKSPPNVSPIPDMMRIH
jgi:hypothetical protein